jgi:RNA polymerase sigma factor (sigma-70 family)
LCVFFGLRPRTLTTASQRAIASPNSLEWGKNPQHCDVAMNGPADGGGGGGRGDGALDRWFVREILALEAPLTRFLRRNWRNDAEIQDLRQEVYVRAFDAAAKARPLQPKPFLFAIARNLIIDRVRRQRIVAIDAIGDLEALNVSMNEALPDEQVGHAQELKRLHAAIAELPARCRDVVVLRKVEGLSQKEVAARLGIAEGTVEKHVANGVRALANMLFGEGVKGSTTVRNEKPAVTDEADDNG